MAATSCLAGVSTSFTETGQNSLADSSVLPFGHTVTEEDDLGGKCLHVCFEVLEMRGHHTAKISNDLAVVVNNETM